MTDTEHTSGPQDVLSWWALNDRTTARINEEQARRGVAFAAQDALIVHIEPTLLVPHLVNVFDAAIQSQGTVISGPELSVLSVPPIIVAETIVGAETQAGVKQDIPIIVLGRDPLLDRQHLYTRARLNVIRGVNRLLSTVSAEGLQIRVPSVPALRNVIQSA